MPAPRLIPLPGNDILDVLYEDRSVLAVDKPAGWILGPETEELAHRNLHLALMAGIQQGAWWARSRNLRFLRFVHRLDAPTTGVLLMVKSQGAIAPFTRLFATRQVEKSYLAVVTPIPKETEWTCKQCLGPDPLRHGRHQVDPVNGKTAETHFRILSILPEKNEALVAASPYSGRSHQIRVHLLASGCPVIGDMMYGKVDRRGLALRAIEIKYPDPFTRKLIRIRAPIDEFCRRYGQNPSSDIQSRKDS